MKIRKQDATTGMLILLGFGMVMLLFGLCKNTPEARADERFPISLLDNYAQPVTGARRPSRRGVD